MLQLKLEHKLYFMLRPWTASPNNGLVEKIMYLFLP